MKLEALRITECPFAFASFAEKHNALVDLISGMTGQNGISVVVSEKNAIIRANSAASISNGNANVNFSNVAVVTQNGLLQNVLTNTAVSSSYPTELRTNVAGKICKFDGSGLTVYNPTASQACTIDFTLVTRAISIREIDVCSGNVAMKMLVLASAPY